MIFKKYQTYIFKVFTNSFFLITSIFFCIVILINFFEEIRFAEKYNTEIYYIIYLSLLNAPSLMFEIFPFIFLISVKYFYLKLNEKKELEILNTNGISNLNIILILSFFTTILGFILLLFFYSFSSDLKSKYLEIKNRFSSSNEYLAVVNDDGLWIKEEMEDNVYIIHAEKFDSNKLILITITEADKYYDNKKTIIAETANIVSKNWQLNNVSILNESGNKNKFKSYVHNSSFNGEIISNLFANLNALNIYELHNFNTQCNIRKHITIFILFFV